MEILEGFRIVNPESVEAYLIKYPNTTKALISIYQLLNEKWGGEFGLQAEFVKGWGETLFFLYRSFVREYYDPLFPLIAKHEIEELISREGFSDDVVFIFMPTNGPLKLDQSFFEAMGVELERRDEIDHERHRSYN